MEKKTKRKDGGGGETGRGGWLRLHRKLKEHPSYGKPGFVQVWVHFLISAQFKATRARFNGKMVMLFPGQFISSRRKISQETGLSEGMIARLIIDQQNDQQIDQQRGSKESMFTVLKWSNYQKGDPQVDPQVDQQMIHNRSTTDPQLIHKTQNHQAGVLENDPKKERRKEGKKPRSRSGREGDARGDGDDAQPGTASDGLSGVPEFEPLSGTLFPAEYRNLLSACELKISLLRLDPANVIRSEALTQEAAIDLAWLEEEATKRPDRAEEIQREASALRAKASSYRSLGFKPEAKATLAAWKARAAEIEGAMLGVKA